MTHIKTRRRWLKFKPSVPVRPHWCHINTLIFYELDEQGNCTRDEPITVNGVVCGWTLKQAAEFKIPEANQLAPENANKFGMQVKEGKRGWFITWNERVLNHTIISTGNHSIVSTGEKELKN